jgi:two-component system CheB/CheR fusion protein
MGLVPENPDDRPAEAVVVGVGASAGGLEALQHLFERAQPDAAIAYVVIQHLSPDFKSMMPELLARHTRLAVRLAENGTAVEPGTIYLIPPKKEMIIQAGTLLLKDREQHEGPFLPIDTFLLSLAQDQGPRAAAIILSGSGSDGSRGVRAIHEAGGLVIAQTEETAKFSGMPRSALDTGVVDAVLPPGEIAAALRRYVEEPHAAPSAAREPTGEPMERLLDLLRSHTGIDFSSYKGTTVLRRIDRRLRMTHSATIADYLERAIHDESEVSALYQDLLIGVTSFFRDPDAYARLEKEVLPALIAALPAGEELRIWSAACATGAEAYSLAMLAIEALEKSGRTPSLRVFATDVHRASLDWASAGIYSDEELRAVGEARRERFFQHTAHGWQVSSDLRARVVFAQHNVLRDAPFTRLDLISCRNLLIYLKPSAQRRALSLFHFGLKPNGALLLGASETPGDLEEEFVPVDSRWKIYRKRREARLQVPIPIGEGPTSSVVPMRRTRARDATDLMASRANLAIARRYGPPALVVDDGLRVHLTLNGAGRFLAPKDGVLSANAMDLIGGELRFVLASAIRRAAEEGEATYHRVRVGKDELVDVSVMTMESPETEASLYVVLLEPERKASARDDDAPADIDLIARQRVDDLELDLKYARENLQATLEEMEASNEELQATNEELVAANEELQSTNEELHSVNEELYTVNAEHQQKIAELLEMTTDMDSLLESTQVHTIFLDMSLRIRKFTPRMAQTFRLQKSDVGRRINDFAHDLNRAELMDDVERVCRDGIPIEAEVRDRRGGEYLLRVLPYRTQGVIDGVVLTLIEIAHLKKTQRDVELGERRYRSLVRASAAVVFTTDRGGAFRAGQEEWSAFTGQPAEEAKGDGWLDAVHHDDRQAFAAAWDEARSSHKILETRVRIRRASGGYCHCMVRTVPVEGTAQADEWVGYVGDEDAHTAARIELESATARLHAIFAHSPVPVYMKDRSGRYVVASRCTEDLLGVPHGEIVGKTDFDVLPLDMAEEIRRTDVEVLTGGKETVREERMRVRHGVRLYLSSKFPLRDASGQVVGVGGISVDVTERQLATQQMRDDVRRRDEFLAMLSHELRNPLAALINAFYLMDGGTAEQSASAHRVARRQLRHISRLLDDLLDVARLTRGELEIRREPTTLDQVVRDATDVMQAEAQSRSIAITCEVPTVPVPVLGDATRLQQACVNLISNALRFSPGGTRVHVALEIDDHKNEAVIAVVDQGEGIPAEDLERIFELFFQRNPGIARTRGGLGLGLSLVKKIVERHRGSVAVSSRGLGQGSTFTLRIPIDESAAAPARKRAGERAQARTLRVVLVEDNDDAREMLRVWLEKHGHIVEEANDGLTGVELIQSSKPDVAIVDIGLPGVDGYSVARKVRESIGRNAVMVALTGYGREEDRRAAADAGFDAHMTKPIDPDALLRMLVALAQSDGRSDSN